MFLERTVVLALLIGVVGGSTPSIEDVARRYEDLTLITKEPVEIDPYLATYCVSAATFFDGAKKRSGPHAGAAVRDFYE